MIGFVIRRVLWTIPVLLIVILFTFALMKQIQGNPFRKTERAVPASVQQNLDRKFHLDDPSWKQYVYYVKGVATWNLGPSLVLRNRNVNQIVDEHFPTSLQLGLYAMVFGIVVGVPLGTLAALRANSPLDWLAVAFSNLGLSVPLFLVATLFIYVFSVRLRDFTGLPTSGWTEWHSKVLPSVALGMIPMTYFARLVRGSMLETLQQDYVRTAKAKGLRRRRVIGLHVLRNSLIPAVTAAGPLLGTLITGSFIVEVIFAVPGIGQYFITSVEARDYSVVMGLTILYSIIVIGANLIVDVLHAFLDPRIRDARR
jgi:oligopeptide transport system permease protein